ncbi:MAG: MFS transporter [Lachnospiraceae bacterium]|nr:MFS transporter [Lachnospiraceae bacterium]
MTAQEKEKNRFWTLRYTLINVTYFMVFCGIHGYSSVFLLGKGFTNTQIGLCLALANLVSVFAQPFIAGLIDKPGPLTNRNVAIGSTVCIIMGSALLLFIKDSIAVIFILFAFIYMVQMAYQPMIIAMNFEYSRVGCKINFGLARGLGSLSFAISSAILGGVIARNGVDVLSIFDIVVLFAAVVILLTFIKPSGKEEEPVKADNDISLEDEKPHNNIVEFTKEYPKFMLFIVGVVFFFFAHNLINDYFIQLIRPLGGNETLMGYAVFIAAALELPTMALTPLFLKKFSCESMLKFCAVMFLVKTLIMTFATNMVWVFVSEACQMGAYAVLIPVSAIYVSRIMAKLDRVKGQAYINVAITLGGVFSGLICGRLLDVYGVKITMMIGSIVTVMGVIITFIAIGNGKRKTVS